MKPTKEVPTGQADVLSHYVQICHVFREKTVCKAKKSKILICPVKWKECFERKTKL